MKKRFNTAAAFTAALMLAIAAVLGSGAGITYTAAAADPFEGSGTEEDPYLIATADDMAALEEEVNSGESYSGCYFELTADITLPDDWTGIGNSTSNRFCSTFDGAGHTITFPEGYTTDGSCAGVFGYAGSYSAPAAIKDLTVDGELTASNSIYTGAVAAFFIGDLENCISNVSMNVTQYDKGNNDTFCVGGVAGVFSGGTMSGCVNNGEVTYSIFCSVVVDGRNGDYRLVAVGGLLGYEIYRSSSPSKVVNCINNGDVIIASCDEQFDSISEPSGIFFSCLVGYGLGSSTIAACVNTGSVYLSSAVTTPEINVGSVDISVAAINGYKASLTTTCCYTTFDVNESYGEYNTEGDAVTYVEAFDMETIWILNTLNGEEENSMFWTLDDENMAAPATEESPAVVRVLYQFADGTEEAVYVKAGSTASLPDGYSDTSFTGFIPGLTVVTEDITVVEYTGESDHTFVVSEEIAATCISSGYITYTCTGCGGSYTVEVSEFADHTYGDPVVVSIGGYSTRTVYSCTVCGASEETITYLYGNTRYETGDAVVGEAFEESTYAVITTGTSFPDALAAASLAGVLDAPVLITSDGQTENTLSELEELGTEYVYIVGGTASVSETVEAAIEAAGIEVERVAGSTRQKTALAVAEKVLELTEGNAPDTCFIATGTEYADALAASSYAYWAQAPIYLTKNDGTISEDVIASIEAGGFSQVIILGGTASVSEETEENVSAISGVSVIRLGGETRYETAALVAEWSVSEGMSYDGLVIAAGTNYPDALTASALCGQKGSVLLLAGATSQKSSVLESVIEENAEAISDIYVVGGPNSVTDEVRNMIIEAWR